MRLNWTRRDTVFVGLSALVVGVYVLVAGWGFPLDDSWIHQTFARNLATRGEWAFIPGTPSAASTSPLYTALLSIGYAFGVPYMLWTHFLGVVALSVAGIAGSRLALRISDSQHNVIAWIAGLPLILTWHHIWAAASGMETMLFASLTLVLIWLAWRELDTDRQQTERTWITRGFVFGIATALAGLARPEGVMLGGIVALLMLLVRPQGSLKGVIVWGTGSAIGFGLLMSPYLWLNLTITGGLLPNTAAAKFEQHRILLDLPYLTRMSRLLLAILTGGQILLVPGMLMYAGKVLQRDDSPQKAFYLLPLLWALALIALYAARLPAAYQHGRYVMPALPALVFMGAVGTFWLVQWARFRRLRRVLVRTLAGSAVAAYAGFLILGATSYQQDVALINNEMVDSAHWINDNLSEDDLLAVHDIGAVGYFAPRELVDIAGLVSPEITPIVDEPDALWQLMQERDADYLMAFPDQVPGGNVDDPRLCPVYTSNRQAYTNMPDEVDMTIYRLAWDGDCASMAD
jgi:hypothetical protein